MPFSIHLYLGNYMQVAAYKDIDRRLLCPLSSLVSGDTSVRYKTFYGCCARYQVERMTGEMINDFEEFSQSSIPLLFYHDHAQRNLHTLKTIMFWSILNADQVITRMSLQCEEHNTSEDLLQLLYLLHENISGSNGRF